MNLKMSSSGQVKKSKVSIRLRTPKSCGKLRLSPVSTNSSIKQNHEAKSPDSSDYDHIPLQQSFKLRHNIPKSGESSHQVLSQNDISSTSKVAIGNSRKRKLHTAAGGILQEEVTKPRVAKNRGWCSLNEAIDIDELMVEMKMHKKGRRCRVRRGKGKEE